MQAYNYAEHFRRHLKLAYPVMLSQLGNVMVGVADSVMVGQLGATPLAAVSLGNSIFSVILMFGIGISFGITPLVALADGEGNITKSRQIFKHGLIINIVTGVLLFALVTLAGRYLYQLNQPEAVVTLTLPYLNIVTLSILPFLFFQSFKQFAEGLSFTKQAMYITVACNLLNVGLNYLLIYGKLGFPAMGLVGAGYATLISRIIMGAVIAWYMLQSKYFKKYWKGIDFKVYEIAVFSAITKVGLPTGLQFIFEVSAFSAAAIMMGWLGANPLAAHQVAISLASVSYMTATGISAAATVRVGNQLGKKDIKTMRMAGFTAFGMGAAFMAVCCVVFILGQNFLPSLYIDDTEVITISASLLVIAAFFQISDGIQVVGLGALRGMRDVKIPTLITLVAYWVLGLPIGYWLCFKMNLGPEGIWYGLLIGLSSSAILISSRFLMLSKKLLRGQSIRV